MLRLQEHYRCFLSRFSTACPASAPPIGGGEAGRKHQFRDCSDSPTPPNDPFTISKTQEVQAPTSTFGPSVLCINVMSGSLTYASRYDNNDDLPGSREAQRVSGQTFITPNDSQVRGAPWLLITLAFPHSIIISTKWAGHRGSQGPQTQVENLQCCCGASTLKDGLSSVSFERKTIDYKSSPYRNLSLQRATPAIAEILDSMSPCVREKPSSR